LDGWFQKPVAKRRTHDQEVAGSSLTNCAVEDGPGQTAHAHLPLPPSSIHLVLVVMLKANCNCWSGVTPALYYRRRLISLTG